MDLDTVKFLVDKLPTLGGWAAIIFVVFITGKKIVELVSGVHQQSKGVYKDNTDDMKAHHEWQANLLEGYRADNTDLHNQVRKLTLRVTELEEQYHSVMVELRSITRRLDASEEEKEELRRLLSKVSQEGETA